MKVGEKKDIDDFVIDGNYSVCMTRFSDPYVEDEEDCIWVKAWWEPGCLRFFGPEFDQLRKDQWTPSKIARLEDDK